MENSTLNNKVNQIANEAIFQATCEASNVDRNITANDVELEILDAMSLLSFENETTRNSFYSFVRSEVQKQLPALYPKAGMDNEGNWTYDSSKWA